MRIGVMLRHYDQHHGGVRVYTRQLLEKMLVLPSGHEFVLLFRNPELLGSYAAYPNVEEAVIPGVTSLWWDQVAVPKAVRDYGIDVLFNPKYSIPLNVSCPTAWVCHGLDWYVMPWASRWIDRLSHRYLIPRYARKADAIIAVSDVTRRHVMDFLQVPPERVHTVYSGVNKAFRNATDPQTLASEAQRLQLPSRFFLYAGAIYPPKNFTRLVQAYAKVGPARGISLVIAGGENRFLSEHELKVPAQLGLQKWVKWLGWVDPATLPILYQSAQALLLPSLFESFGMPIVEAMASGCPVVTSNCHGTKEIAADAAVLVDPYNVDSIAAGMQRVIDDGKLRAALVDKGAARSQLFSWDTCAAQTLRVIERLRPLRSRAISLELGCPH